MIVIAKQAASKAYWQHFVVAMTAWACCLTCQTAAAGETMRATYPQTEIWHGTKLVSSPQRPEPSTAQLKSTARQVLDQARQYAQRGDVATARHMAKWARDCPVTWHAGETSPTAFLATLPPAGSNGQPPSRQGRRRPSVLSFQGGNTADRYPSNPPPKRPSILGPSARATQAIPERLPATNPLRHGTEDGTMAVPYRHGPTPREPVNPDTNAAARSAPPVAAQAAPLGGFWAGMLAGIATIVLLMVVLLWRLKARGGAVLRLEFLTPQGLDEASLAAFASNAGNSRRTAQPAGAPLPPQPAQAPQTFADKKLHAAEQQEQRESAIVEHIFQENLKLRQQFQTSKQAEVESP